MAKGLHRRRLLTIAVAALLAGAAFAAASRGSGRTIASGTSPAQPTAQLRGTHHFEYVVAPGAIDVYSIDDANRLVGQIPLPQTTTGPRGVVASPRSGLLYISYGGQGGSTGTGSMLAFDLRRKRVVWQRDYDSGVDSMAITPDGKTIYLPVGEGSGDGTWRIVDAQTGAVTGAIVGGAGAHNTIMGADGRSVYLGGVDYPYLDVASTATGSIVRRIGPLNGPGVRPFTINGSETLAFTTARSYLGFQVSSIVTGKVLFTVPVSGFTWDPQTFGGRTPDHGIALSPDERRLYLIDTPNGYVHVYDVGGLPAQPPRQIANVKLAHPPPNDGWLQLSRDGRYLYVGRAGDVIDTRTLTVTDFLPPLQSTADCLEIDWRGGRPIATTSRYSVGYVRSGHR